MDPEHDHDDRPTPPVDATDDLDAAWRRHIARLDELRVVSQAHHIVADAENARFVAAIAAARQRLAEAQQRLAQSHAGGDAAAVGRAAATVADAHRAVEQAVAQSAAHLQQLVEERVRNFEDVVTQAGHAFNAGLAATEAIFGVRPPDGDPPDKAH